MIIEQVTEFMYLGSHLSQHNNQKYINRNLIKYNRLNGALKINFDKQMRKEIQLKFYNIVSKPALLRQRDKSRINSSKMRFLRSLNGVTLRDRIKSEEIRKKWKVEEMIDNIQNYQQKWNQHALRMPENRLSRKALPYRPQRKRDLGRPCRRWKDQFM
jgi:hypothetical protein